MHIPNLTDIVGGNCVGTNLSFLFGYVAQNIDCVPSLFFKSRRRHQSQKESRRHPLSTRSSLFPIFAHHKFRRSPRKLRV